VAELTLPPAVQKEQDAGKKVEAAYHVEVVARVRGARWDLHRRLADEESAIFLDPAEAVAGAKPLHLASTFLSNRARVTNRRASLGFSLDLRVLVPEYIVDGRWFNKDHHDGGYLFRDKVNLEATFTDDDGWVLKYGWDQATPNLTAAKAPRTDLGKGSYRFAIPVVQATRPGITGVLRLETRPWNEG
jgi:hypothetical protein